MTKTEKIAAMKAEFENRLCGRDSYVKNIGKTFFTYGLSSCVLRDVVYNRCIEYDLELEVLLLDGQYFVGSKEHAYALKESFGGSVFETEFCHYANNARELYIWEKEPERVLQNGFRINPNPMDFEKSVEAIF